MGEHILAIDQGTTGSTCLVIELATGRAGRRVKVLGRGYRELEQHFPQPGWVEHDLNEIWAATEFAMGQALRASKVRGSKIDAIGITNQRETTGIWDLRGRPVHRAIVWQDRRTADRCTAVRAAGHGPLFRARTGLVIDPYFSGTKVGWLLDQVPGLRQKAEAGNLRFGTIDTWLLWKLTTGVQHKTDASNASRTLLYDIKRGQWDAQLCDLLGRIPASLLPEVCGSAEIFGHTKGLEVLPDGIPVAGIAGDQQSALFGQACLSEGMGKCTYGTGAFALVNTGIEPVATEHLLATIAWRINGLTTYALEGSVFIAGAAVQWLRDGLKLIKKAPEIEKLARSVPDSGEVVVVPAFTGLGAPHWRPEARGIIAGITRGTTAAHLARATLEGIAFQVFDLFAAMTKDYGRPLASLRVDGGACANDLLMQFQADLLGIDVLRPEVIETTALGAGFLAGLGAGIFADTAEIERAWKLDRAFQRKMAPAKVDEALTRWHAAVQKA